MDLTNEERDLLRWALSALEDEYLYDDEEHADYRERVKRLRRKLEIT